MCPQNLFPVDFSNLYMYNTISLCADIRFEMTNCDSPLCLEQVKESIQYVLPHLGAVIAEYNDTSLAFLWPKYWFMEGGDRALKSLSRYKLTEPLSVKYPWRLSFVFNPGVKDGT